ncbi:MAG: hypothetical protein K6B67_05685 [Lachnospiraceae bacterium]|nr:hypothetical protein [Lachnospiraceae bacterium]
MADIELVIKIPEGLKNDFELEQWTALSCMEMKNALEKATPLPKGHGKIIDATFALEAKITKDNIGVSERTKGWNEACQAIYENASAIIEADKESEE